MENSSGNSHGTDSPKKSRSLDLKSLYESEISKESESKRLKSEVSKESENKKLKRKASVEDGDTDKEKIKKKKKIKKAVSLSSLKNIDSNSSKSLHEVYNGCSNLGLHDTPKDVKTELGQKSNCNNGGNGIFLHFDDNDVQIPRRKRDFVGRSKFESSLASKLAGQSSSKVDHADTEGVITLISDDDLGTRAETSKVKRKKDRDDFKENTNGALNLAKDLKDEDEMANLAFVKNGQSKKSGKDWKKKKKKKKNLASNSKRTAKDSQPLIDSPVQKSDGLREDDEENLEENAARMLSSRFDTSCTGFTSKGSASPPTNGLSFFFNGSHFVARGTKRYPGSDAVSVDSADRVLRPRRQPKDKGNSRQRRHYYEICSSDFDVTWVLNKKIKVFWPLDQHWYYGLVNEYDEERKLHHVKYDDRDEEWINLQNERFKLLLLPSEAPGTGGRRRSRKRDEHFNEEDETLKPSEQKEGRGLTMQDDSSLASNMDSEPIISWLARSNNNRVKSSSSRAKSKMKSCGLSPTSALSSSDEECLDRDLLAMGRRKCSGDSASQLKLDDAGRYEESASKMSASTSGYKPPIIYVRKRFRKTLKASSDIYKSGNVLRGEPDSVISRVSPFELFASMKKHEDSLEKLNPVEVLWSIDTTGFLKLTPPLIESRPYRFNVNLPPLSVSKLLSRVDTFGLFQMALLDQYGAMTTVWPMVQLEMLFVDSIAGLRLLLFEGSLKQAVSLVIVVFSVFHQQSEPQKYDDQQLPATSIRFKFSCMQGFKKQLVFAFYNFAEVESLKWKYLESKLERHCLLNSQLPLAECTFENISALQHGTDRLPSSSTQDSLVSKGLSKKSRQGIVCMGVSRDFVGVTVSPSCSHSDGVNLNFPLFALPFTAVPTFFISLHLKLLMGRSVAHIIFGERDTTVQSNNSGSLIVDDPSSMEDCSYKVPVGTLQTELKTSTEDGPHAGTTGCLSSARSELETVGPSVSSDGSSIKSFQKYQNGNLNAGGVSACSHEADEVGTETVVPLKTYKELELEPCVSSPKHWVGRDKSNSEPPARLNGITVDIPPFDQLEKRAEREVNGVHQPAELGWNMNGRIIPSPNPTGRRSTSHRSRGNSSLSFGHGWSDGKGDLLHNNFSNGPKKPRTQVSYSIPFGGVDYSSKNKSYHLIGHVPKRIRGAHEKRSSGVSRSSQRNLELLSCEANVLITLGDRGWRESGAHIVLELFYHNEWKISVKISGVTRYSFKAHQFLQHGSANRYTHAMMWKGGKDCILEFPDRSQWMIFKEMHKECYDLNLRASVKNIPIPGVWLVEDYDDIETEAMFVRSSSKYFQQVETDIEMALNPFRVLYDMDNDDEKWISETCSSEFDKSSSHGISDELFEKTMDMLEKAAYGQQRDQFTCDEIEQILAGFGSMEIIKIIYDYWRRKRQKKGMPLIRHLQTPLWERYQKQVREWEIAMSKIPIGFQEKAVAVEKPPMSAFCLKPRGLEVPNKGSKQRSQKKSSVFGKNNAILDHYGRRSNGFAYGIEKAIYSGNNYDIFDDSSLAMASPRLFSPHDIGGMGHLSPSSDGFGRNYLHRLDRSRSKKFGMSVSPTHAQMMMPHKRKLIDRRNGTQRWDSGFSDWHYHQPDGFHKDWSEQLDGPDLDEFRLREASTAAKHARNLAKLKRENAQKLLRRADLAIHKALSALMTAEAIKASAENSNGAEAIETSTENLNEDE